MVNGTQVGHAVAGEYSLLQFGVAIYSWTFGKTDRLLTRARKNGGVK